MKKLLSVALLAVMIMLCMSPFSALAEESGEVVYQEDFEYGETDIQPTSEKTGTVQIKSEKGNHYLHFEGNKTDDYSLACFGPYVADFDFKVKIRQKIHNGSWSNCMILFHIDWNVNAYRVDLFEDHARMAFNNGVDEETVFGSYDGFGVSDDKWYNVEIFGRGNEYTVTMDGKVITTIVSDERDEGNFGFCGWQTEFDVDDIEITEYVDGTAPPVDTFVEGIEESGNRDIIETKRPIRKMENVLIEAINLFNSSSSVSSLVLIVSVILAVVSSVVILLLIITHFARKKRKTKL